MNKRVFLLCILVGPLLFILYMNADVLPSASSGLQANCPWSTCGIQIARKYINSSTLRVPESRISIMGVTDLKSDEGVAMGGEFYQDEKGNYVFLFRSNDRNRAQVHSVAIHEFMHGWVQAMDNEYALSGSVKGGVNVSGIRFNVESREGLRGSFHYLNGGLFAADEMLAFRAGYIALVNMALDAAYAGRFDEVTAIYQEALHQWDGWQKISGGIKIALADLEKYLPSEEAALLNSVESANLRMTMCRGPIRPGRFAVPYQIVLRRKKIAGSPKPDDNVGLSVHFPAGSVTETKDASGTLDCKGTPSERAIALKEFKRIIGIGEDKSANDIVKSLYWDAGDLGNARADVAWKIITDLWAKKNPAPNVKHYIGKYREYLKNIYITHPAVRASYLYNASNRHLWSKATMTEGELTSAFKKVIDETPDSVLKNEIAWIARSLYHANVHHSFYPECNSTDYYPNAGRYAFEFVFELCRLGRNGNLPADDKSDRYSQLMLGNWDPFESVIPRFGYMQDYEFTSSGSYPPAGIMRVFGMHYRAKIEMVRSSLSYEEAIAQMIDAAEPVHRNGILFSNTDIRFWEERSDAQDKLPPLSPLGAGEILEHGYNYIGPAGGIYSASPFYPVGRIPGLASIFASPLFPDNNQLAIKYSRSILALNIPYSGRGASYYIRGGRETYQTSDHRWMQPDPLQLMAYRYVFGSPPNQIRIIYPTTFRLTDVYRTYLDKMYHLGNGNFPAVSAPQ